MPRFDVFIDEDKQNRKLGALAVSNAVALNRVLQDVRFRYRYGNREIKWNEADKLRLPVAVSWLRLASGFTNLRFEVLDWPPRMSKGDVLAEFLPGFLYNNDTDYLRDGLFDSVVFLDFDGEDARSDLHLWLARRVGLLRCYALDSKASNCLQLADLLLGVNVRIGISEPVDESELIMRWGDVDSVLDEGGTLSAPEFSDSESKKYLAAYWRRLMGDKK